MVFITNELKGYSTSLPIIIQGAPSFACLIETKDIHVEPNTCTKYVSSPQQKQWKVAMQNEYKSLLQNKTWTLIDMPRNQKVIQCKWIFQTKSLA
jgi:hypothetical protein